jgi:hypothetical protein
MRARAPEVEPAFVESLFGCCHAAVFGRVAVQERREKGVEADRFLLTFEAPVPKINRDRYWILLRRQLEKPDENGGGERC